MQKENYIPPRIEVIRFETEDVITTSGVEDGQGGINSFLPEWNCYTDGAPRGVLDNLWK